MPAKPYRAKSIPAIDQTTMASDPSATAVRRPEARLPQRLQRRAQVQTVAQVAMDDNAVEPIQDPFGDYPPLRANLQRPQQQKLARQERTGRPISVLNRPVHQRGTAPQTELPSANSFQSIPAEGVDYSRGELIRAEDSNVELYQDELDRPSQPADMEELGQEIQDSTGERIDDLNQLEELPGQQGEDDLEQLDDETGGAPEEKTCDEFRTRLLDNPVTDIALDISPPRSSVQSEYMSLSRTWTDRRGNVLATGTMTELSRGYVILDSGQKLAHARLSVADLKAIAEFWQLPDVCTVGQNVFPGRNWIPQTVTWKASSLCHKPLYFENVQLERYGHSHGPFLQPIHSTGHFFARLFLLPLQMGTHPANECQYALGFYRPGDCAPWLREPLPISLDGIKYQTLVTIGLAYIP